jgi:hypothetical protein
MWYYYSQRSKQFKEKIQQEIWQFIFEIRVYLVWWWKWTETSMCFVLWSVVERVHETCEQLIELSSDSGLKMQFRDLDLVRLRISPSVRSEFPELSEESLKIVRQFSTTCLCEKVFSSLLQIKTKHRSRLSVSELDQYWARYPGTLYGPTSSAISLKVSSNIIIKYSLFVS